MKMVFYPKKTTFKCYDQDMVGLNFKEFPDLEKADFVLGKPKQNWKRDSHGVKIPHRVFQCSRCGNDRIYN